MSTNRFRVNNKEKQKVGGNWGHPRPYTKKITEISEPLYPEDRHKNLKRKKKEKKPYFSPYEVCPFCEKKLKETGKKNWGFLDRYEKKCRNCGAKKGKECPACKGETWYLNKVYKHQNLGCGFVGKKINKNRENLK